MKVKILHAQESDLEEILSLQKECYIQEAQIYDNFKISPLTQTIDSVRENFAGHRILKAVSDGKIVGSVRAKEVNGIVFIGRLIVHPTAQNKGLGKKLMNSIEESYPRSIRFELFTGHKSLKNISLYTKLGYKVFKREKMESNPEMLFMEKLKTRT